MQDLRHNVLKTCACCFLVCGHFSVLQVIAITKTISCQGDAGFAPLCTGLGQLICNNLSLSVTDCNYLLLWTFFE